ncbi:MAG: nuclear transport factor 2 family protein [Myxococcota bacterium]
MLTDSDRRACYDLALHYARAVDRRVYAALLPLLAPDALIAVHPGDPSEVAPDAEMRGHAEVLAAMPRIEAYRATFHLVGNQTLEADGEGRARGETYCTAHHIYARDGRDRDRTMHIRYQDRFARAESGWVFSERRLWVVFTSDRPLEEGAPS